MRVPSGTWLLGFVVCALIGCASSGPNVTTARSSRGAPPADLAIQAGMAVTDAQNARKLYVLKCAKCHAFYEPAQYHRQEWSDWMTKMSRKARLSPGEETLLRTYLDYFREHHS